MALAPRFTSAPAAQSEVVVREGDPVRIGCRVAGRPPPDIQWFRLPPPSSTGSGTGSQAVVGHRLLQDERHSLVVNESGAHALLINKTVLSDSGVLACVAHNRSGEATFQVLPLISLLFWSAIVHFAQSIYF